MKALPSADAAFADTQALWRFLSNPRVKPVHLAGSVLALSKLGIEQGCDAYALAEHDWSRLNFHTHTSKPDRVRMTHHTDVGYELQSTVLVADRDGSPIGAPTQNLRTAHGVLSSRWDGVQDTPTHLNELSQRMLWLDQQRLGRTLVLTKAAKPKKLDAQGKRIAAVPGKPLTVRLGISRVRGASNELLAEWYLLSHVQADVEASTLALWYALMKGPWRWCIESYLKLLKGAGQQVEHWEQESGSAIFKRLLIASHACALAWRLMRAEGEFAEQTRASLVRLSGRQTKRNKSVTVSALLSGLYMLFVMNETLHHYSPEEITAVVREARGIGPPR
jgi:hypothetical protein